MKDINTITRKKYYDEFRSMVNMLYDMAISKESLLAKQIKEFPANLFKEVEYTLGFLKEEINKE